MFSIREASRYAQSLSAENTTEKSQAYDEYLLASGKERISVIRCSLPDGKQISLLPRMNSEGVAETGVGEFADLAMKEWGCAMCGNRIHKLSRLVSRTGEPVVCNLVHPARSTVQKEMNRNCWDLIRAYNKQNLKDMRWEFQVVTPKTLYQPYENAKKDCNQEYLHYFYVPESVTDANISSKHLTLLKKALSKYTPLISNLLEKVGPIEPMRKSCQELRKLLHKSKYGNFQVGAIDWFMKILDKVIEVDWISVAWSDRLVILAKTICGSGISKDDSNSAFLGHYHTMNNYILDILENGKSVQDVISKIESRNAPDKYRRKTAPPSEGNIRAAEKFCKNLVNTIETVNEVAQHSGCVAIRENRNQASNSAEDAFAQMRAPINKYGAFASKMRASESSTAQTMSQIVEDVKSGKITRIQVNSTNRQTTYTARTTLSEDDLSVKTGHLWAFMNKTNLSRFAGFWDVTHVYDYRAIGRHNIHFILKDARSTIRTIPIKGNCCFPEFLAPHNRGAEKAFEALNKLTNVEVPNNSEPLSLGVGCSVSFDNGKLTHDMKLRITSGSDNEVRDVTISTY